MKNLLLSLLCVITFMVPNICRAGLNDNPTIAVLPFVNKASVSEGLTFADASIASEFVIEALIDSKRFFNVLERENMTAIINEHTFNMSATIDPMSAVQVGKMLGVQYLIAGSITGLSAKTSGLSYDNSVAGGAGGEKNTVIANVSARIIEVETGRIVLAASGTGSSASTNMEFTLKKKIEGEEEVTVTDDESGIESVSEGSTTSFLTHKIKIGAKEFSQVQVRNALYKAVDDLIFNKNYGILAKMDGSGKRRRV